MSLSLELTDNYQILEVKMSTNNPTNKVTLRDLTVEDLDAFMKWARDEEVTRSLMWDYYKSKDDAQAFLKNIAESHPWFKAICLGDQVIGSITLDKGKGHHSCKAELGYVIAKAHWSKGYATKAIKQVLQSGFDDLGIVRIEALVDPENLSSVRALEKAGFTLEGRLKNCIVHKGTVKDRFVFSCVRS